MIQNDKIDTDFFVKTMSANIKNILELIDNTSLRLKVSMKLKSVINEIYGVNL